MPAASSSPIDPAIGQLLAAVQSLGPGARSAAAGAGRGPRSRARRGVRHRLAAILGLALCAVLAGARSFTAIAEWAVDADQATREALGVHRHGASCEFTFRRTLQSLDADALDDAAGSWAQQRTIPAADTQRAVAVDGKILRGSGVAAGRAGICWPRWITGTAWSWAKSMPRARRTRFWCSPPGPARLNCGQTRANNPQVPRSHARGVMAGECANGDLGAFGLAPRASQQEDGLMGHYDDLADAALTPGGRGLSSRGNIGSEQWNAPTPSAGWNEPAQRGGHRLRHLLAVTSAVNHPGRCEAAIFAVCGRPLPASRLNGRRCARASQ
jgi:hypothetical protein